MRDLLQRPNLPPDERLLVATKACLWPGDHARLARCLQLAHEIELPRCQVEEVFLQAILFCGFPRVVNGFHVSNEEWPIEPSPSGGALPAADQRPAGDELFSTIYGQNSAAVKSMLRGFHAELEDFVLDTAYGRILSRPGLEPRVRELLAVGLLALTDQVPQMVAHGRGALKFGASHEQIREAIYTTVLDESRTAQLAQRL